MNPLCVLSDQEVEAVSQASLVILNDVGIHVPQNRTLEILADSGAPVDMARQEVRIPGRLVLNALDTAGKRYVLHGRDHKKQARFGYGDFVLCSTAGQYAWVDEDGGPRREPTREDLANAIRLNDALDHIDIVGGMAMPLDVPVEIRDIHTAAEMVKGTTKPFHVFIRDGKTLPFVLEILEAVSGGKQAHREHPMIAGFVEPISPLRFSRDGLDILVRCAEEGLPLCFGPMAQCAATAPATLAGTLAVETAEILAGITIAQLIGPGCPVCFGGIPHIMDMQTMMCSFGSPEQGLMAVAMTQIAKRHGLPVYVNVGIGDSKRVDAQSGLERGMTLLMGALAGADTFGHMGIAGADQAASLEQLIVDNEMAGYVKRLRRGFQVNDDTLALEVINRVGIGGNFLAEEHTVDHYRQEMASFEGFDRRPWEPWYEDGARSMADWARERKEHLLAHHQPEPLDEELGRCVDEIVASASMSLVGS